MAIENIVRISELPGFVESTLLGIRDGVAKARAQGLLCELPEKVDFQVTVIQEWQALEISSGNSTETIEEQGGGTREVTTRTESGHQERNGTDQKEENASASKSESSSTADTQSSEATETKTDTDTVTSTSTVNDTSNETVNGANAHNQNSNKTITESA